MKYKLTYRKRGELTDKQKAGVLQKLKLSLAKEKDKGVMSVWILTGPKGVNDSRVTKVLKKYKVSKEMSQATIEEA